MEVRNYGHFNDFENREDATNRKIKAAQASESAAKDE
jgi:hypothetical protein